MYEYTTGNLPEYPESKTQYLYENVTWSDILTGVRKSHFDNGVEIIDDRYSISSDTIGNITNLNGFNYTWVGRQLKSVSPVGDSSVGATYSYNSDGQRIGKNITLDDGETYDYDYYYNGDILAGYKLVITNADGSSTTHNVTFMYDENGEAFGFNYNGNDYYYVRNAQSDVIFISNSDNTGVVMYQYDAWGNMTACYDTSDDGMLSVINPYAYRGYFYEIETNTYFLKSRYYNPELCRFISADGLINANQDILGNNLYAYCSNNPIKFCDSTGHSITLVMATIAMSCVVACVALIGMVGIASTMNNTTISVGIGNAIDNIASGISVAVSNAKTKSAIKSKVKAEAKTRRKILDTDPRKHHIVAKGARMAAPARNVLKSFGIDPKTAPENLITIPQGLHKSIHTNKYYDYVNNKLLQCDDRESVEVALLELRADIKYAELTGIKVWDLE